jgi:hypothetical protein
VHDDSIERTNQNVLTNKDKTIIIVPDSDNIKEIHFNKKDNEQSQNNSPNNMDSGIEFGQNMGN